MIGGFTQYLTAQVSFNAAIQSGISESHLTYDFKDVDLRYSYVDPGLREKLPESTKDPRPAHRVGKKKSLARYEADLELAQVTNSRRGNYQRPGPVRTIEIICFRSCY